MSHATLILSCAKRSEKQSTRNDCCRRRPIRGREVASTAEAVCDVLPEFRLVRPRVGRLPQVAELPLADLKPVVVWLDEIQAFAHQALSDTLKRLFEGGHVVIGTIRREELRVLAPEGDVRNPALGALRDERLVHQTEWRLEWGVKEQRD